MRNLLLTFFLLIGVFMQAQAQTCNGPLTVTVPGSGTGAALSGSVTGQVNIGCNGATSGSITINVLGGTLYGTAPAQTYQYRLNGGAWVSTTGVTYNASTGLTHTITGLTAGTYNIDVIDANSCQIALTPTTLTQPAPLSASISVTNNTCNVLNGSANSVVNLTVTGGVTAYTYAWSNSASTEDLSNVAAGTYSVTVTDANTCTVSTSTTVTQPSAMTLASTNVNNSCNVANGANNASIDLTVTNGVSTFSYAWSNSATTQDLNALAAGTYSVTVTDADGCTATFSTSVTQPAAMTLSETHVQNLCNSATGSANASIDLTVTNGVSAFTYAWTGAASYSTEDISNLAAGTYNVLVTDNTACTATTSVTITQPTAIALSETHVNNTCNAVNGAANASIDLTASGGTGTLGYAWSNSATTQDITALAANTYTVTVTDANACTATLSATVTQPSAMTLASSNVNNTCNVANGANNASIDLTVTNGVSTFSYAWSNSANTQDLNALAAGTYSVTVTDADGCTATFSTSVTEPAAMTLSETHIQNACNSASGANNASIDLTVTNGVSAFTYAWTGTASYSTEDISNLAAGTYNVLVTDNTACTASTSVTITQPTAIAITLPIAVSNHNGYGVSCTAGQGTTNDGTITVTASGGTGSLTYDIGAGAQASNAFTALTANTYSITVKDGNNCTATASAVITAPTPLTAGTCTSANDLCQLSQGQIKVEAAGGVPTYNVSWTSTPSGAAGTPSSATIATSGGNTIFNGLQGNATYHFVITDLNGCVIQ